MTQNMQSIPKPLPIKRIITETPFVKTFVFEHRLDSKPGQFVLLWIPRLDEKPVSIAYDGGDEFWTSIFAVGPFSKKMHELKEGDFVGVRGPYGSWYRYEKGQRLVLVAGGYGAAPMYDLAYNASKEGCKVDFVVGARSKEHLLFMDRLNGLDNVALHVATDDGSFGEKGFNTLLLAGLLDKHKAGAPADRIDCVYTCGPEMMMKKVSDMCFESSVPAQVSLERYMKCGFGVCGQCCVDATGERMCKEGPVLSNERVRQLAEFGKYRRDSVGKIHNY